MCGRFTLYSSGDEIARALAVRVPDLSPRYNVAPTQLVAAVRAAEGGRELAFLKWGLVPSWSKDAKGSARLINARAETVADKPAFRAAFRRRRCLIPTNGYYEWSPLGGGKQPYFIRLADPRPFALAGLWEEWHDPEGEDIESCAVVTAEANDYLRPLHERMPVILDPKDYDLWLDAGQGTPERAKPLLAAYPGEEMRTFPVGPRVNNPRNEGPACIEPLPA
jgi:putative SOS response-associated peptidase YedK